MKIEDMCCTPEQSKRLRELGVDQKSYFYHTTLPHCIHLDYIPIGETWDKDLVGSAWTVAEMGIMFPPGWYTVFDGIHWHCKSIEEGSLGMVGMTQAQAMAFELISLLESTMISITEVNKIIHV